MVLSPPAAYALDATHLILQGDLIEVEQYALKKRAKLLDKLIKKLEKIFADRNGGGFNVSDLSSGA